MTQSALRIPSGASLDGWTPDSAPWTYASATTFTVAGDVTAQFSKGTRIKLTQTTVKYFVVIGSSHSAGTTTVTITGGSDYSLANASITSPFYSYAANPQGYPGTFAFTPTTAGYGTEPTLTTYFSVVGNVCTWTFNGFTSNTSDATTFTTTAPITPASSEEPFLAQITNNGARATAPGMIKTNSGGAWSLFTNLNEAAWTASGIKWARFTAVYRF